MHPIIIDYTIKYNERRQTLKVIVKDLQFGPEGRRVKVSRNFKLVVAQVFEAIYKLRVFRFQVSVTLSTAEGKQITHETSYRRGALAPFHKTLRFRHLIPCKFVNKGL